MTRAIRAEIRKVVTTKTVPLLLLGMAALALVFTMSATAPFVNGSFDSGMRTPLDHPLLRVMPAYTGIFVLLAGLRSITDELRFGTLTPSFLVTPRRTTLLAAKALVMGAVGAVMAVVVQVFSVGVMTALVVAKGAEVSFPLGATAATLGLIGAGGALLGAIGVGVGAVIRSQPAALVVGTAWFLGIEQLLAIWVGDLGRYLPGQALRGFIGAPDELTVLEPWWIAGAVLAGYAAVSTLAGMFVTERRDVA